MSPVWSASSDTSYAGQYPLSIETFVAARVGTLLPGITSITPHARYYPLHAYIALELEQRPEADPIDFLRRCEVAFCAVSAAHRLAHPDLHQGLAAPHGEDAVAPYLEADEVPIQALAAVEQADSGVRRYSSPRRGFLGQYANSEALLGLTDWSAERIVNVGATANRSVIQNAFAGLGDLAMQKAVNPADLEQHEHMCVCGEDSGDRPWLRQVFLPAQASDDSNGGRRRDTLRLLHRLIELHEPDRPERQLPGALVGDPETFGDRFVARLPVTDAWRGVILRNWYTGAWRDFWGWIVNDVFQGAGRVEELISDVTDRVVADLGTGRLIDLWTGLPAAIDDGEPTGAGDPETYDGALSWGCDAFLRVLIGASRAGRLPARVDPYFENPRLETRNPQLTPTWLNTRVVEQGSRPLADFVSDLVATLIQRAQRVSVAKTRFSNGRMQVPGTLSFRDGYVIRVDREGSDVLIMRWQQAVQVMAELGLVTRAGNQWHVREPLP